MVLPLAPSYLALHKLEFRITLGTQVRNLESFEWGLEWNPPFLKRARHVEMLHHCQWCWARTHVPSKELGLFVWVSWQPSSLLTTIVLHQRRHWSVSIWASLPHVGLSLLYIHPSFSLVDIECLPGFVSSCRQRHLWRWMCTFATYLDTWDG